MIIHISLYTLKPEDKQANAAAMLEALAAVPEQEASIRSSVMGQAPHVPVLPDGVGPVFCDIAQILTFDTPEAAMAYPASPAHTELAAKTGHMVDRVFAIDFPV